MLLYDRSEFQEAIPQVRTEISVWPGRRPMIELAAEIADGLAGHPIWSVNWATNEVPKHVKAGLDRAGKQRSDFCVSVWLWVTPNTDVKESINDARGCTSFYAGVEQYESYFAAHGFREEARQLQEGVKRETTVASPIWFLTRWRAPSW